MARALNFARMIALNLKDFLADARAYRDLSYDERNLFWKRIQAWTFLALMPVFLALGAVGRLCRGRGVGHPHPDPLPSREREE